MKRIKRNSSLSKKSTRCPHCGKIATTKDEISLLFGWRKTKGKQIPQSWCYDCRAESW